jgi:hypothetical protein
MTGPDWGSAITLVAALLALAGVALGNLLEAQNQRQHWRLSEEAASCVRFLGEFAAVYSSYFRALEEDSARGANSTTAFVQWAPYAESLDMLNVVGSRPIVEAAHRLDRLVWMTGNQLLKGDLNALNWRQNRAEFEAERLQFINVARRQFGKGSQPLLRLNGRPPEDDPFWARTQSP